MSTPVAKMKVIAMVLVLVLAASLGEARPSGKFKSARDITDCTTCVEHGYGWCPRRRRCGYFKSKVCSGTSTDFSVEMLTQELTSENYKEALYDERRISFVWFHSELDKAQSMHIIGKAVKMFSKADNWKREVSRFFTVNHDRYPAIARVHGLSLPSSRLPALVALEAMHKPKPEWKDWPAFMVAREIPLVATLNHRKQRTPENIVDFVFTVIESSTARIPELDALVPRFMAEAMSPEGNATDVYLEAQQVVADLVGELVAKADAAAAELERQREAYEAKQKEEGGEDGSADATAVAVETDGNVADEDGSSSNNNSEDAPLHDGATLDPASIARLRTVQTGAPTLYLDVMATIIKSGHVAIVREVNELRHYDTPRPTPVRVRLEVMEVFIKELF